MTARRDAALAHVDLGRAVFPLRPRTKLPAVSSKRYQTVAASREQVARWWLDTPDANMRHPRSIRTGGPTRSSAVSSLCTQTCALVSTRPDPHVRLALREHQQERNTPSRQTRRSLPGSAQGQHRAMPAAAAAAYRHPRPIALATMKSPACRLAGEGHALEAFPTQDPAASIVYCRALDSAPTMAPCLAHGWMVSGRQR